MQGRRDAGLEGCRTEVMQDGRDAGQDACRAGGMQDRRNAGQDGSMNIHKFDVTILAFTKKQSGVE